MIGFTGVHGLHALLRLLIPFFLGLGGLIMTGCGPSPEIASGAGLHALRLDANVTPLSQELELDLDPDSASYEGRTAIRLEIRLAANSLRLHAEGVAIQTATIDQDGEIIPLEADFDSAGLVTLRSRSPFKAGKATLRIAFTQTYNTQSTSLYKVESGGRNYVFSQFEAWDARKAFPCFDEPAFKIPWTITVRTPDKNTVIGNYPVVSEKTAGALKTVSLATTRPMSSYLVAFAIGEFDAVPIRGMSVPGNVYTVKGQGRLAGIAAEMSPPLLQALEDYFGTACPKALSINNIYS